MAQRRHILPVDVENIPDKRNITLPGKMGPNKGLTKRTALGDRTNQEVQRPLSKPVLKKVPSVPTVKEKKLTVPTQNTLSHVYKPEKKVILKPEEKKKIPEQKEKPKNDAYSVKHFGLLEIEEKETDPLLVPCYVNDIVYHLRNLEIEYLVSDMFLAAHKTTPRMRTVLINWLVDVHLNFRMVQETLYLCVSIIDRYLQRNKAVGRENLQLVGITALFIASKYEETYPPEISDLVYVCDDVFSKKKILQMEQSIIKALDFKFGNPCSLHFLRRYTKVSGVEHIHYILAKYLLEVALIEHEFSYVPPSLLASAAIFLSTQLIKISETNEQVISHTSVIERISGYSRKTMVPVMKSLSASVLKHETSKYQAVKNKYGTKNNQSISCRTELKNGLIRKLAETK